MKAEGRVGVEGAWQSRVSFSTGDGGDITCSQALPRHQVRTPRSRATLRERGPAFPSASTRSFLSTYCVPGSGDRTEMPVLRGAWLCEQDRHQQGQSGARRHQSGRALLCGALVGDRERPRVAPPPL